MKEFAYPIDLDAEDAVQGLVDAASQTGGTWFMKINGIKLIVDGASARQKDYAAQLMWTYGIVASNPELLDARQQQRTEWGNLVPDVQKDAKRLMARLRKLDMCNTKEVLQWLAQLALASCCTWALPNKTLHYVSTKLHDSMNKRKLASIDHPDEEAYEFADSLIDEAMVQLGKYRLPCLGGQWCAKARKWLSRH